jgi:DNA-binding transcriptional MerR regulator
MDGLSAAAIADLAGTTVAEVQRLVDLGILVRDGAGPFRASDVQRVRLVHACERAGLPLDGIAAAIRAGRLSPAFVEAAPYRRWAARSARTYRQVSQETGVPLEVLAASLESMGFARMAPDEPIREDELEEVVPLLELAQSMGSLDRAGMTRIGRAWAEGLRLAATVENQEYTARFAPLPRELGTGRWEALEQVARLATELLPLVDRAFMARYRRQQELVWTEDLVEDIGGELEAAGALARPERVPAMCFLDLTGYTRWTEERGDQAAGPVVAQGGDYFGRTVNLAARIAAHAGPGQVLVSERVAEAGPPAGVALAEAGEVQLKGFARPVRLLEASRG